MNELEIINAGDSALFCRLSESIDPVINRKVMLLAESLHKESISGITEWVPSYSGIMIYFDPLTIDCLSLRRLLLEKFSLINSVSLKNKKSVIILPVCYGNEYGPDISVVAKRNQLSVEEVITIHSTPLYYIYMLGFTPGFPYLGGMDNRIETPRKKEPRLKIAAGSVGIAGDQTGIYPLESPGGWQIIGKTPLNLFNPRQNPAFLLRAGLYIKFEPVDSKEFIKISREIESKSYKVIKKTVTGK